ncbi:MAG: glycosyltransferase, partial [Isosphaeraceae bacterium]
MLRTATTTPVQPRPTRPKGLDWLHLCNGLDPVRDGGMVPSILGMTGALAGLGEGPVTIVTPTPSRLGDTVVPRGLTLKGPETDVEEAIHSAQVVHMHGLWQGHTRRGGRIARASRVPYLIAAHGMAEPWSLRHKALKKRIYTALIEGKNLRRASCLHALSRPEIGHLRAIAPRTPVCFVPNGVDLEPLRSLPDRSVLTSQYPELSNKFILLFYGRLHLKKGLDLLAEAFAAVSSRAPDLHLLLAGNDDGALGPFLERCEGHGLRSRVTCVGHVSGERAREVWGAADAFILPSYSEGFSMAILEALACRLPALITTACHFPELARVDGGIVVEPNVEGVTAGLRNLLERSPVERAALGERGGALVERDYTWETQARRLAEVYQWLAGGGPPPTAVVP